MLLHDHYYIDLETMIRFRVMGTGNGASICKDVVSGKMFVWTDEEVKKKNLSSIPKPETEYISGAQIRGGEIQDRTI